MPKMKDRPFEELMQNAGYTSVAQFADVCGVFSQQVFRHVRGKTKPTVDFMVKYANNLGMQFMDIVEFFYPDEMSELQEKLK